jgi:hypothetical protein
MMMIYDDDGDDDVHDEYFGVVCGVIGTVEDRITTYSQHATAQTEHFLPDYVRICNINYGQSRFILTTRKPMYNYLLVLHLISTQRVNSQLISFWWFSGNGGRGIPK